MRTDIVTITLNPTVDYATATDKVFPEHKLRCEEPPVHRVDGREVVQADFLSPEEAIARGIVGIGEVCARFELEQGEP